MADLLRIAKERRDKLLAELAWLDEFLRMAEALEQLGHSSVHPADDPDVATHPHPARVWIPGAIEGDGSATSDHAETRADTQVKAEAPALLLTHHSEDRDSAHSGVAANVSGAMALPSEASLGRNTFADYLEALRERIERHFRSSRNLPEPVSVYPNFASGGLRPATSVLMAATRGAPEIATVSRISTFTEALRGRIERHFGTFRSEPAPILSHAKAHLDALTFGNAGAAEPTTAHRESMTAPQSAGVEPTCEQGGAAIRRADAVKSAREPAGSMADLATSIRQLRGGQTSTFQSTDRSFDIHLGQRLRQRRWMLGMSRKQLGHCIGLDREQIERYETGLDEVDATRLWKIAAALGVPVAFFFEGLDGEAPDGREARGEVLSDEEARLQFDDFSDDTFIFVTSRSA